MENASGIYEIVNTVNEKRYVGSAVNIGKRWKLHLLHLRRGTHHSPHLQASWVRHGESAFSFNVLDLCERSALIRREQDAIDALSPEFNVCRFAGSALGTRRTPEQRAKMSAAKMGNTSTRGYKHTPETIEKMRAKQTGVESPTKGKKRDAAAVAATARAHTGMKRSDETRAKIAAKALGRKRTPESLAKYSATVTGRKLPPEQIAHLLGNKHAAGRRKTDEERQHLADKVRAAWAAKRVAGIPWRPPRTT